MQQGHAQEVALGRIKIQAMKKRGQSLQKVVADKPTKAYDEK